MLPAQVPSFNTVVSLTRTGIALFRYLSSVLSVPLKTFAVSFVVLYVLRLSKRPSKATRLTPSGHQQKSTTQAWKTSRQAGNSSDRNGKNTTASINRQVFPAIPCIFPRKPCVFPGATCLLPSKLVRGV
jgi:hypothetical protein